MSPLCQAVRNTPHELSETLGNPSVPFPHHVEDCTYLSLSDTIGANSQASMVSVWLPTVSGYSEQHFTVYSR